MNKQVIACLTKDLKGLEAKCPYCGAQVRCNYENDKLIWWINVGEPCPHFKGMYSGYGEVVAHFQKGGEVE